MKRWKQAAARAGALVGLAALSGCAGMGSLGDVLGGMGMPGTGGEVRGEVRYVDTRSRELEISSGWGGSRRVEYDRRTEVLYRQRRYSVSALERGDVVSMRVRQDRRGRLYTDRIYVERSVRDRGRSYPGDRDYPDDRHLQSYSGRVDYVDRDRGIFEMRGQHGRTYLVYLPERPSRSTRDRFRRLRRGDHVRFEGEQFSDRRVELYRFR